MNKSEILIIDDEPQIRKLLQINLEGEGYKVFHACDGKEGVRMAASHPPDLILLDVGLPDISGQLVLKELRTWFNKSIIMLSVQNGEADIIQALDNGATDYLAKPFRAGELLARIRASIKLHETKDQTQIIICGNIQVDLVSRTVLKGGEFIKLTSTEYNLLALFAKNLGRVMTHQYILKEIWGNSFQFETQYLRVFVASLRKKIEDNPTRPVHLLTESGVGYRFL